MRKSLVVNLALLNSVLAISGCARPCEPDDKKDQKEAGVAQSSCRGGHTHGGGGHYFWGGSRSAGTSRPAPTSTVSRGGFGGSAHAAS